MQTLLLVLIYPFKIIASFIWYVVGGTIRFIAALIYLGLFLAWAFGQLTLVAVFFAIPQDEATGSNLPQDAPLWLVLLVNAPVIFSCIPAWIINGFITKQITGVSEPMSFMREGFFYRLFWSIWFALFLLSFAFIFVTVQPTS